MKKLRVVVAALALFAIGYGCREVFLVHKESWPNGHHKRRMRVSFMANPFSGGRDAEGFCETWYEDGKLEFSGNYKANRMDGLQTWYGEDGAALDQWVYQMGRPVAGKRASKWPNGKIRQVVTYDGDGEWKGNVIRYSPEGKVVFDWDYVKGVPKDGHRIIFFDNGLVWSKTDFLNGKVMRADIYDSKGRLKKSVTIDWTKNLALRHDFYRFKSDENQVEDRLDKIENNIQKVSQEFKEIGES